MSQGLATEVASFISLLSDVFRYSLLLLIVVDFTVISLSVIHLGFLFPIRGISICSLLLLQLFLASQNHILRLFIAVVSFLVIFLSPHPPLTCSLNFSLLSSASHLFTLTSRCCRQTLSCSLQLSFLSSQDVLLEIHKRRYGPAR